MPKSLMSKENLEQMYLKQHLTMEEIGKIYNLTRQGIFYRLKRFKIDRTSAERFNIKCMLPDCSNIFSITRKRFKTSQSSFCSMVCYHKSRNPNYKQWRQGLRIARKLMSEYIGRPLFPSEVVHHIDGNHANNNINNLKLFSSNSEHLKHHHHKRIKKLNGGNYE